MESLGDLDIDTPTDETKASRSPTVFDRMQAAEVRLAFVASGAGSRALEFLVEQKEIELPGGTEANHTDFALDIGLRSEIVKHAAQLLLTANDILKDQEKSGLDIPALNDKEKFAGEILNRTPLIMYEVLTLLAEGASRTQVAQKLGLSDEYVSTQMGNIYRAFDVNQPQDAVRAVLDFMKIEGSQFGASIDLTVENPRNYLPKELADLTDSELDILGCVCLGMSNKQIARERLVSVSAIKFHLRNIYRKLGLTNRMEALRMGLNTGLMEWVAEMGEVSSSGLMAVTVRLSNLDKADRRSDIA